MNVEQGRAVLRARSGIVPVDFQRPARPGNCLHLRRQRWIAEEGEALGRGDPRLWQGFAGKAREGHQVDQWQHFRIDEVAGSHWHPLVMVWGQANIRGK